MSVYLINAVIFINSFGLMIIYFIVIGDIAKSLVQDVFAPTDALL
jgi:amino acid permease